MTLKDYELKFYDELVDDYDGSVKWSYYVRACYKFYMHNKDEQKNRRMGKFTMIDVFLIMGSIHVGGDDNLNEINPGIAIRHEHAVAGVYENSFNDTSIFVGGDKHWNYGNFEYGAMAGLVSGYDKSWTAGDMTAFVAPYVSYDFNGVKPTVLVMGNAVTFSVGYSF